jgi:hypothetical protein
MKIDPHFSKSLSVRCLKKPVSVLTVIQSVGLIDFTPRASIAFSEL